MNEPKKIYKGLSYTWTESVSDYPAGDGWTLKYSLSNASTAATITTTASGDEHVAALTATTTGSMTAGTFVWISYADNGTLKEEVGRGEIQVLTAIGSAGDRRTHARKMLDSIEAILESRATREQEEMTIAGRMIKYLSLEQLIKARAHYEYLVRVEAKNDVIAQGGSVGDQILVEFRNG